MQGRVDVACRRCMPGVGDWWPRSAAVDRIIRHMARRSSPPVAFGLKQGRRAHHISLANDWQRRGTEFAALRALRPSRLGHWPTWEARVLVLPIASRAPPTLAGAPIIALAVWPRNGSVSMAAVVDQRAQPSPKRVVGAAQHRAAQPAERSHHLVWALPPAKDLIAGTGRQRGLAPSADGEERLALRSGARPGTRNGSDRRARFGSWSIGRGEASDA